MRDRQRIVQGATAAAEVSSTLPDKLSSRPTIQITMTMGWTVDG